VSSSNDWSFPFEEPLHQVFPALHDAQSSWLSQIDSLQAPDRKTHELIRLVCTVILRNPPGIRRHAQLAREVGADWDEVLGSIMLTLPAFGMLPAVEAIPHAREGFDAARPSEEDD
jgi:alkylhydroperoxidase/carboxymuconolactone decarboxylase family protein YurZ